jgi:hypothetical protein
MISNVYLCTLYNIYYKKIPIIVNILTLYTTYHFYWPTIAGLQTIKQENALQTFPCYG